MGTVVFDIEANGLLEEVTQVWVIAAISLDGKKQWVFTDEDTGDVKCDGSLRDGVRFLARQDKLICHNLMGYDYHLIEKFWPALWSRSKVPFSKCWDTYAQSRVQNFSRPTMKGYKAPHGLAHYGALFNRPKPPIEDWSYWDADKLHRCLEDIEINRQTYIYLQKEAENIGLDFNRQIRRTQVTDYWYTKQELFGFYGNKDLMINYVEDLDNQLTELRDEIEPLLPKKIKPLGAKCTWQDIKEKWDRFYRRVPKTKLDENGKEIKPAYMPVTKVYLANGNYNKFVAKHFGISDKPDESNHLVAAPFTKLEILDSTLSQHAIVKDYLLSLGWKPTQWNYEKEKDGGYKRDEKNQLIKKSPKLTEDSFDSIKSDIGQKIATYNTLTHRRRTFLNEKDDEKGWINSLRDNGRIASGATAWNTETGRASQYGIVNVPSAAATFGAPMREVWQAPEGRILVSVDMDSAQLRMLANFMGDAAYTEAVLNGTEFDDDHNYVGTDPHTMNAIAFGVMNPDLVQEARETQNKDLIKQLSDIRKYSKNGIYAYLFGAGDMKLATTLKMRTAADGKRIKESFSDKLPAIAALQARLLKQWNENKWRSGGYIQVAGETWVYCPHKHKLLNYLLMGSEAVLQNQAICWLNVQIEKRGLTGLQVACIHDEINADFPIDEEQAALELMTDMYGVCSKAIGLEVLVTGTAQSGKTWLDIH